MNLNINETDVYMYKQKEFSVNGVYSCESPQDKNIKYEITPIEAMEKFPWLVDAVRGNGKRKFSWCKNIEYPLENYVHFEYTDYEYTEPSWWKELKRKFIRMYKLMHPRIPDSEIQTNLQLRAIGIGMTDIAHLENEAVNKGMSWFLYYAREVEKMIIKEMYDKL